ncbi:MAG TPA: TIM barrel protein [Tepidisphaeraceae bacterium]|nr:TIM barrel protein [Tepidisphaeraceae bacterium]
MNKLAVTARSLHDDIRIAAGASRKIGFDGMVVPSRSASLDLTELGETGTRDFRHILASYDQILVAIDSSLGKAGFSLTADVDRALARMGKVLQAAAGLGCTTVCLDLGPLPPAPVSEQPKPAITPELAGLIIIPRPEPGASASDVNVSKRSNSEPRDAAFESHINSAMTELGQIADRFSIAIAARSSLASFASLAFLLDGVQCPWFGVDLDTIHMLADEWPADAVFSTVGAQIRHVRARDAAKGAGGRVLSCDISAGSVDWPEVFTNLDAAGYKGWVTADCAELPNSAVSSAHALRVLRQCR